MNIRIEYARLAKKARDEVKELDEPYRSLAYQTVLNDLIQTAKKSTREGGKRSKAVPPREAGEDPVGILLRSPIDAAQYVGLFKANGKLKEKSLAVLKLARDELGVDGLTAPEIAEILVKKFRVPKVYRQNVSRDLGRATEYVTRVKTNGDYKYLLMLPGEQRLEEVASRHR